MSAAAATSPALVCSNCGQPLHALRLAGHYASTVTLDLCAPCHLVWFDAVESARLAGPGLLSLIGEMASAQALAHQPLRPDIGCPICGEAARTVHNRTRWGHSLQLECPRRHGAWQTFGQFLGEKGLLRPMSSADRARALQSPAGLHCVNCGGAVGEHDTHCLWCTAVPALVDVARLAQALDPEGATAGHAVHRTGARATALACMACGAPQPADAGWNCLQCGATLTATGLADAHHKVAALGPALHAHADKPAPHVVRQRLKAQAPALQRQRERAAAMQAEADQRSGRVTPGWGREGNGDVELPPWAWAVLIALAVLLGWLGR